MTAQQVQASAGATAHPWPSRHILGMRVDLLSPEEAVSDIIGRAAAKSGGYCCVTNVHQCVLTHDEPEFREVVNGADVVVPDSTILRRSLGLRYGLKTPPAVRGAELMLALCRAAERERLPVALIGGRDDEILGRLVSRLRTQFPALPIAFTYSPPFREPTSEETEKLAAELRASGAQLVFVGLGCPKQERWMARFRPKLDAMMVGVGAAFDFNSGEVKPSPAWVHKAGLEWLYRLLSEPGRLWRRYLTTSPRFLWLLVTENVRSGTGGHAL